MSRRGDKNLLVGLDIGTSKIACLVGEERDDGLIEIVGVGTHPSRGLKRGVVVDIESTVQSIQRAVEEAELMAGCEIHSVHAGIAGSHIRSLSSHGITAIKDREVSQADMDRVIDAARAVSDLGWWGRARTPAQRLAKHRFHLIEAGHHTAILPADSKIQPDRTIISRLFLAGYAEAGKWLERHRADIGRRGTADLAAHLGKSSRPDTRTSEAFMPESDEASASTSPPRSAPASGS